MAAAPGTSATDLRDRLRAALPASVDVRTGAEQAAKDTSDLESNLSFIRTFLLVFAYVSLFVGAFIIFNTFSITVAQRTREFALLRTLGASRSQVMRSVILESLVLGAAGALLGLVGGLLLAPALDQLFKSFGADLPDSGTVLRTRTIVVSLAVGISVTVLAGLAPALRATRVPPLAAMREGVELPSGARSTRARVVTALLLAVTLILTVSAIAGSGGFLQVAIPAVLSVVLAARLVRAGRPARHRIVRGLAGALGALVAWRGVTGRLARENSIRQPGRTLITAAALTIGLALVAFVAVLADGTKATIDQAVSRSFAGNLIVENSQAGTEQGIPALVAPAVCARPGCGDGDADRLHGGTPQRPLEQRLDHRDRSGHFLQGLPRGMEERLGRGAGRSRHQRRGADQRLREL